MLFQLVNQRHYSSILNDEELAMKAQLGDHDAATCLIIRYRQTVLRTCKGYYFPGADRDDVVQEGTIGLFKAIRDYNCKQNVSFRAFAILCIRRQIITALKTATRLKHEVLNASVSLFANSYEDSSRVGLIDFLEDVKSSNPEVIIETREILEEIQFKVETELSELESRAFKLYLDGASYQEIADSIGVPLKSITNTMYRVQKKLKRIKNDFDLKAM